MSSAIPSFDRAFAREVRSQLVRQGIPLSAPETYSAIGVSAPHFSRLLNGRARWFLFQSKYIADLLDIPLRDLVEAAEALIPEIEQEPAA